MNAKESVVVRGNRREGGVAGLCCLSRPAGIPSAKFSQCVCTPCAFFLSECLISSVPLCW